MDTYYIYCIINKINGKTYTGQRKLKPNLTIEEDNYFGSGLLIKNAINKYGLQNFNKEILWSGQCSNTEINEIETYYIKLGKKIGKNEYNIKEVGAGGDLSNFIDYSYTHTQEHRNKISKGVQKYFDNLTTEEREKLKQIHIKAAKNISLEQKMKRIEKFQYTMSHKSEKELKEINAKKGRSGNKNGAFGKHWFTNGKNLLFLSDNENIPKGYVKGNHKTQQFNQEKAIPIICLETKEVFPNINAAIKKYNCGTRLRIAVLDSKLTCGGYHWATKENYDLHYEKNAKYIIIYYDNNYNFLYSKEIDNELLAEGMLKYSEQNNSIKSKVLFKVEGKHYREIGQYLGYRKYVFEEGYYE